MSMSIVRLSRPLGFAAALLAGVPAFAATATLHLQVAPRTVRSDEVTLIWDNAGRGAQYILTRDGHPVARTTNTYFTAKGLAPEHAYAFAVEADTTTGQRLGTSETVRLATPATEPVVSVERYGAKGDGETLNTKAIQAAIDACPRNGVVLIPAGVFVSGALFLKSDMTLYVAKGGVLKGSTAPADYEPFIRNRFEGWELSTYASLLNAGRMDHNGPPNVRNVSIRGEGEIRGGGAALGNAMIAAHGLRSRGRLICLMNCAGVEVQGLTLDDPPCWTLHYIYCRDVSLHDLTIRSTVRNGDGMDPDSSANSFIFDCSFSTGDDCIAIKSGKNPEGNVINRPTEAVRIFDCTFTRGHGISVGSEMSGGVRGVLVEACVAGPLLNGMQIKGTEARGGYVEDVTVRDCDLQKITVLTALNYNNDGAAAPQPPVFRHFRFENLDLSTAPAGSEAIIIEGFAAPGHRTQNVTFKNVKLPAGAIVKVDQAQDVRFENVTTADGAKPRYEMRRVENVER